MQVLKTDHALLIYRVSHQAKIKLIRGDISNMFHRMLRHNDNLSYLLSCKLPRRRNVNRKLANGSIGTVSVSAGLYLKKQCVLLFLSYQVDLTGLVNFVFADKFFAQSFNDLAMI
ncbi:hypothetical protein WS70_13345 [Burkholderia mayonis]|uniref:Uncharacterized protein n=1 Tax=Burkholderia mayonis TaxID=1385591 RepID=A0A1B4FG90_9BURK|nr:hypothetical protein WS70_13345 [Burkholderia mayonis]KVE45069.1 hypothetical protein WS70_05405 [Burkholderia mayonis]